MTIKEVLANYKKELNKYWDDEKYKWVAVQHFQDHWNIEAEDFAGMLKERSRSPWTCWTPASTCRRC